MVWRMRNLAFGAEILKVFDAALIQSNLML
jgi:hypothetical protein